MAMMGEHGQHPSQEQKKGDLANSLGRFITLQAMVGGTALAQTPSLHVPA